MKYVNLFEYLDAGPRDNVGYTYASCIHCRDLICVRVQVYDDSGEYFYVQYNMDLGYFEKLELREKFGIELSLHPEHSANSCSRKFSQEKDHESKSPEA